jgi:two-component system sensor histidine kinase and response regulator WspE
VAVAVDGKDGWNSVRAEHFDLVVTDVDMPRMNGLELVQAIRADPTLRSLPVIIVSYKERDEDRLRGLEVGANCYLTKSSFHDNTFLEAVTDLIGET